MIDTKYKRSKNGRFLSGWHPVGSINPNWKILPENEIIKLYNEGYSIRELSFKFGFCSNTIRRRLKENGIRLRTKSSEMHTQHIRNKIRTSKSRKYDNLIDEFKKLFLEGYSLFNIAKKFNCNPLSVSIRLKKLGFNTTVNRFTHKETLRESEKKAYEWMIKNGFEIIFCQNRCADQKLSICSDCPIKTIDINHINYDFVFKKDGLFGVVEVKKPNESFSFNQAIGLLKLEKNNIPYIILTIGDDDVEIHKNF